MTTDELNNLRSITLCGADTEEWMDNAIQWGAAEIERLRAELAETQDKLDQSRLDLEKQGYELVGTRMERDSHRANSGRVHNAEQRRAELEAVIATHRDDDLKTIAALRAEALPVAELRRQLETAHKVRDAARAELANTSKFWNAAADTAADLKAERDQLAAAIAQVRAIPDLESNQLDTDTFKHLARGHNAVLHDIKAILDGKATDV